jgi:LysM repeat protein
MKRWLQAFHLRRSWATLFVMRLRTVLPLVATGALAVSAGAQADFAHVVVPGESLSSIAAADGLSVSELAAANGMAADAQLVTGAVVQIPPQGSTGSASGAGASTSASAAGVDGDGDSDGDVGASASTAAASSTAGGYTVQPGDTLSAIAARAGLTVAELAAANGIDPSAPLLSGTTLTLTGASSGASTGASTTASAASQPVGTVAQGSSSAPPYPTPERVTAAQVGAVASANGVSPSLAAAIGWQESGFNNDLVSSADARGVMQILPGTWDWIQRTLTPGAPLAPASAIDNVRGGVLLLHSLLATTGGDPALAAAGYYQGLSSVQRYGMFSDTQRYVNNVLALRSQFGGP